MTPEAEAAHRDLAAALDALDDAEVAAIAAALRTPAKDGSEGPDWGCAGPLDDLAEALYDAGLRATPAATPEQPPSLDARLLARAMIASGLVRRFSDYAHRAHPETMYDESPEQVAGSWAREIAAEYARLAAPSAPSSGDLDARAEALVRDLMPDGWVLRVWEQDPRMGGSPWAASVDRPKPNPTLTDDPATYTAHYGSETKAAALLGVAMKLAARLASQREPADS